MAAARKSYILGNLEAESENRWSSAGEHRYSFVVRSKDEAEAGESQIAQRSPALFHMSPYRFRDAACQGILGLELLFEWTGILNLVVLETEPGRVLSHLPMTQIYKCLLPYLLYHNPPKRVRDENKGTFHLLVMN